MLKHNKHLKHNNTNLIKDTIMDMGTKRRWVKTSIS